MLRGQSTCSGGVGFVNPQKGKPKGCQGSSPGHKANSSGCAASPGSKVVGSPGAGSPIGSSSLGLGNEALSTGAGVMESCLAMSNMLRCSRSPPQVAGQCICKALTLLCSTHLGHSRMNGTPLESHGQCHHFFAPCHLIILGFLELS